ncbi:hypothetical protein [Actinomycetospora corticicola]|uniref:Uncharacterized protein n=1 Tax=Actinomycetospora corticicola TaxID=663602 RepID=A0A7Y9J434_9PSEU|nr:hypothetical protein [Actinomycetospora corticicola]NYD34491.1 hypothetical protein [Actinomycetospora corticicola]
MTTPPGPEIVQEAVRGSPEEADPAWRTRPPDEDGVETYREA